MRPSVDTTTGTPQREATWRSLPGDFLHDQKDIWWTFPKQLAKGHHWVPTLAIVGGTAGLIYADPHVMPYFRTHQENWDDFNDVFDPMITTGEVIALPASLMAAGYIRHDNREVSTALLAAEAYGDSVVVNLAIKAITRRERPSDVPPGAPFTGTFFNGGKSPLKGSSFPSGHSTAVWSVATVVAERYRHRGKPWVPVFATRWPASSAFRGSPNRPTSRRMCGSELRSAIRSPSTRRYGHGMLSDSTVTGSLIGGPVRSVRANLGQYKSPAAKATGL